MSALPLLPPAGPGPDGASSPEALAAVLRSVRRATAALEAGRSGEASHALCDAARVIVSLHLQVDDGHGGDEVARAFRWIAFRLKDADLLQDARAARDAERALVMLARGLRRRRLPGGLA